MGRAPRSAVGNEIYHVINRANSRDRIFHKEKDYAAFEEMLFEAQEKFPMRILAFCLMPNHWHLLLYPLEDSHLSQFMRWITLTHTQRWHTHYKSIGYGHLYQGRFKSFLVQKDEHFLTVARYVERNALRAKLSSRAEDWRWGSAWLRTHGTAEQKKLLSPWPVPIPDRYLPWLNNAHPHEEDHLANIRGSILRGRPYGKESWVQSMAEELNIESTLRSRGRPRNKST